MKKECPRCQRSLDIKNFCKDRKTTDGLNRWCRKCVATYKSEYYRKHRLRLLQLHARLYRKDRAARMAKQRAYYWANPERARAAARDWQKQNMPLVRARLRKWYAKQRRTNPQFRLRINLRRALHRALSGQTTDISAIRHLGCTVDILKTRLEKLFHSGMTWRNYGRYWHVDHIRPLSLFDLSKRAQIKRAVHYTNLQPMLVAENIRKGGRNRLRIHR